MYKLALEVSKGCQTMGKTKAASVLIIMLSLFLLLQSFHVQAQTGNLVVRISPEQSQRVNVGDNFTISVLVDNAVGVAAVEVVFTYDPTILNATNILEGPFLRSAAPTIIAANSSIVNLESVPPTGKILFSCAIASTATASGSGDLLDITFSVIDLGGTKFHLIPYVAYSGLDGTYFTDNVIKQQPNGQYMFTEYIPDLVDGSYGLYVSLASTAALVYSGQVVTFSGTVAGLGEASSVNATLQYNLEGGSWNTLVLVTTNESGFFQYDWTAQTEEFTDYEFRVSYEFEGSTYQSPIVVVTVEAAFTPLISYIYIALLVLLIIIVVLSIFVFIRNRRKTEEVPELNYS